MGSCPGGRKTETRSPREIVDGTRQPRGSLPVSAESRQAVEGRVGRRNKRVLEDSPTTSTSEHQSRI